MVGVRGFQGNDDNDSHLMRYSGMINAFLVDCMRTYHLYLNFAHFSRLVE